MPSAPTIVRQLIRVLDKNIIPSFQAQVITQVHCGFPFKFSGIKHWTEQSQLLVEQKSSPLDVVVHFKEAPLVQRRMALLGVCYSGASIEKIGLTRHIARNLKQRKLPLPAGITAFKMQAPCVFYVPANTPHIGEALTEKSFGISRMLITWFTDTELWMSLHDAAGGGTHNISLSNARLIQLAQNYTEQLAQDEFWNAQQILLDMLKLLKQYLEQHSGVVSNSAWPSLGDESIHIAPHISPRYASHCYKVIDYIQFHLHTSLSLEVLAQVCGLTVPHLSHVFRKSTGVPLMQFVTERRVRAAELMLSSTTESIGDIAKLVGFSSSHSFNGVFRRMHGMTPSQYRRKNLQRG